MGGAIDRPHVGLQQAAAALGLVHGGDADAGEALDRGLVGAGRVADADAHLVVSRREARTDAMLTA